MLGRVITTGTREEYLHNVTALVAKAAVASAIPGAQDSAQTMSELTSLRPF